MDTRSTGARGVVVATLMTVVLVLATVAAQAQAPPLTILTPAPESSPSTTSTTIDLSGLADANVVEVTWSNDRGGQGICAGTASWFATGIPLSPGLNELTITARDASDNTTATRLIVRRDLDVSTPPVPSPPSAPVTTFVSAGSTTTVTPTASVGSPAPRATLDARTASASPVSLPGLVAAYTFDEGSGTTVADLSGNGNTGTLSGGVTWTTEGKFGKALVFHGSSSVTVADSASLDLASAMTLEAWVYPTATPVKAATVVMKEQPHDFAYALYAGSATGRPRAGFNTDAQPPVEWTVNGGASLPLDAWTHLAAAYDTTTGVLRLYVNGVLAGRRDVAGAIVTSTGPLRIGGNGALGEFFRGRIDDVRVYNRALSEAEVRADMVTPLGLPASVGGQWSDPIATPIVSIHGALLHTGHVLIWDGIGNGGDVHVWDPAAAVPAAGFTKVPNSLTNIFCSGLCALSDGRLFVVGGHQFAHTGLRDTNIYDPGTSPDLSSWTQVVPMSFNRWYPTATLLPDERVLVTAGENGCSGCNIETPEIYDPATNTWTELDDATQNIPFYPHMFVLPDGRVFAASATEGVMASRTLDLTTHTWTEVDPRVLDAGSAVMYRPGKIMKSGTHNDADLPPVPSEPTTYVIDMTQPTPAWVETPPMHFPRGYHNLTILPDGQVLATGGGDTTDPIAFDGAILPAELWSPATQSWTLLAPMRNPRLYHSIALLLPDARVLVGGGRFFSTDDPTTLRIFEIFSPPYLFKGARPVITTVTTNVPGTVTYGEAIQVQTPSSAGIASVVLIRPGSVTHSFNGGQRYVPLTFTRPNPTTLTVQGPANTRLAPPGYYMLFLVNANGVPSTATFLRVQ